MRFAAYAGTSAVLAVGVILRAFHERPNFYSAAVYLSQSNACLMILTNLVLLLAFGVLFGLQRLLYGPLRAIEVEQLYEKAWFAVTETCLAMTIFREEIGAWFLVMFVTLLAAKVWGWIGEGRVEFLEQQPPANPTLFHTRLATSLILSVAFDFFMLNYCGNTVLEEARPGMMVMFAFEFAVLTVTSTSTIMRYAITLKETMTIREQTQARLQERRAAARAARETARREAGPDATTPPDDAAEEEIDEADIDVPGWEEKGRWIFYLDLGTDLVKLIIYMVFFSILLAFNGLPIHILRDVFMTARSFVKRVHDFVRYRNATRDMNARYPDARAEDLRRESTCIICREEMTPWEQPAAHEHGAQRPNRHPDERLRPKKLPCGHVLHFGCLRSWLERQQVCPTCRRSVLVATPTATNRNNAGNRHAANPAQGPQAPAARDPNNPEGGPADANGMRIFNLGPLRIAFGAWPMNPRQNIADQVRAAQAGLAPANAPQPAAPVPAQPPRVLNSNLIPFYLLQFERHIAQEIQNLHNVQDQIGTVRTLQTELERLRAAQQNRSSTGGPPAPSQATFPVRSHSSGSLGVNALHGRPPTYPNPRVLHPTPSQPAMGAGDRSLPEGMALPPGWTLLPLHPVGPGAAIPGSNNPYAATSTTTPSMTTTTSVPGHTISTITPSPTPPLNLPADPERSSISVNDQLVNGNLEERLGGNTNGHGASLLHPDSAAPYVEPQSSSEGAAHQTTPLAPAPSSTPWSFDNIESDGIPADGSAEVGNSTISHAGSDVGMTPDGPSQPPVEGKGKARAATVEDVD